MSPIDVVHIITKLELGGAQQNTLFTIRHLNRKLFRPTLITSHEGILVPEALAIKGIRTLLVRELIREMNPLKDIRALLAIKGILKEIKRRSSTPLIVHTHSSKAGIVGRWAARCAGVDVIIHTIHGFGFNDYQSFPIKCLVIMIEKLTASITDMFIAVSRANIQKGINLRIFSQHKTVLIRSGIELHEFERVKVDAVRKKKELGMNPNLPLVTMIGCLKPQKAPLDYVEAVNIVLQKKKANFVLAGDGILRDRVQKRAEELGLGTHFRLLGWRRDIPEIMAASDIFVLTSLWEGLPRVLPEAMAQGIPIVATSVDGNPEVVIDGVNGYLIRPKDIQGVAKKIIYLLDHQEEAKILGKRGKGMVGEFDIRKMVKKQEELYLRLLREKGKEIK